jgi:acetyl-CoA C-acetyltransferase
MPTDVVIVSTARTPIGTAYKGSLVGMDAYALAEVSLAAALDRCGLDATEIEDIGFGESMQGGGNIGRNVAIRLGMTNVPGVATQRWCASAMAGVQWIAANIAAGMIDVGIGGGAESMSTAPQGSKTGPDGEAAFWLPPANEDTELAPAFNMSLTVGDNAARIAGVTREEADSWAFESHRRAVQAIDEGRFKHELVPVTLPDGSLFEVDEHPRRNSSLEKLASLPVINPLVEGAVTTAGNASGLNDASAALVMCSADYAEAHGLTPLARIMSWGSAALAPEETGLAPTKALPRAVDKAGLALANLDSIEINEAFASMAVASTRIMGLDHDKVNVNGSGCSLGHPIGATGARMIVTMVHELRRIDGQFGAVAMCAAGGMGSATVIERLA